VNETTFQRLGQVLIKNEGTRFNTFGLITVKNEDSTKTIYTVVDETGMYRFEIYRAFFDDGKYFSIKYSRSIYDLELER